MTTSMTSSCFATLKTSLPTDYGWLTHSPLTEERPKSAKADFLMVKPRLMIGYQTSQATTWYSPIGLLRRLIRRAIQPPRTNRDRRCPIWCGVCYRQPGSFENYECEAEQRR